MDVAQSPGATTSQPSLYDRFYLSAQKVIHRLFSPLRSSSSTRKRPLEFHESRLHDYDKHANEDHNPDHQEGIQLAATQDKQQERDHGNLPENTIGLRQAFFLNTAENLKKAPSSPPPWKKHKSIAPIGVEETPLRSSYQPPSFIQDPFTPYSHLKQSASASFLGAAALASPASAVMSLVQQHHHQKHQEHPHSHSHSHQHQQHASFTPKRPIFFTPGNKTMTTTRTTEVDTPNNMEYTGVAAIGCQQKQHQHQQQQLLQRQQGGTAMSLMTTPYRVRDTVEVLRERVSRSSRWGSTARGYASASRLDSFVKMREAQRYRKAYMEIKKDGDDSRDHNASQPWIVHQQKRYKLATEAAKNDKQKQDNQNQNHTHNHDEYEHETEQEQNQDHEQIEGKWSTADDEEYKIHQRDGTPYDPDMDLQLLKDRKNEQKEMLRQMHTTMDSIKKLEKQHTDPKTRSMLKVSEKCNNDAITLGQILNQYNDNPVYKMKLEREKVLLNLEEYRKREQQRLEEIQSCEQKLTRVRAQSMIHANRIDHVIQMHKLLKLQNDDSSYPENATVIDSRQLLSPLLPRAQAKVDKILNENYSSFELSKELVNEPVSRIALTLQDLQLFRPGAWLNDEVINVYVSLLLKRNDNYGPEKGWPSCHITNTFFFARLVAVDNTGSFSYDYARVRRWTRLVNVFEKDRILFPINLGNTHWTCAMIDMKRRSFEYFDSLGGTNLVVLESLSKWLVDEANDKQDKVIDVSGWEFIQHRDRVPQQDNGSDCGVFVCKFLDCLSRGSPFDFTNKTMPYTRQRIAHELLVLNVE